MGKTGVGKSTTIQYIYGLTMVKTGKHIQADPNELKDHKQLQKIICADSTQSVTRYCQAVHTMHNEEVIGILDTPGSGDTKCAEVDMSN